MIIQKKLRNGNSMFSGFLGKLELYSDKMRRKMQKVKRKSEIPLVKKEKTIYSLTAREIDIKEGMCNE
jgi:hypothetical protein